MLNPHLAILSLSSHVSISWPSWRLAYSALGYHPDQYTKHRSRDSGIDLEAEAVVEQDPNSAESSKCDSRIEPGPRRYTGCH